MPFNDINGKADVCLRVPPFVPDIHLIVAQIRMSSKVDMLTLQRVLKLPRDFSRSNRPFWMTTFGYWKVIKVHDYLRNLEDDVPSYLLVIVYAWHCILLKGGARPRCGTSSSRKRFWCSSMKHHIFLWLSTVCYSYRLCDSLWLQTNPRKQRITDEESLWRTQRL